MKTGLAAFDSPQAENGSGPPEPRLREKSLQNPFFFTHGGKPPGG